MQLFMEPEKIISANKITAMDTGALIQNKLTNGVSEEIKNGMVPETNKTSDFVSLKVLSEDKAKPLKLCENGEINDNGASSEDCIDAQTNGTKNEKLQDKDISDKEMKTQDNETESEVNLSNEDFFNNTEEQIHSKTNKTDENLGKETAKEKIVVETQDSANTEENSGKSVSDIESLCETQNNVKTTTEKKLEDVFTDGLTKETEDSVVEAKKTEDVQNDEDITSKKDNEYDSTCENNKLSGAEESDATMKTENCPVEIKENSNNETIEKETIAQQELTSQVNHTEFKENNKAQSPEKGYINIVPVEVEKENDKTKIKTENPIEGTSGLMDVDDVKDENKSDKTEIKAKVDQTIDDVMEVDVHETNPKSVAENISVSKTNLESMDVDQLDANATENDKIEITVSEKPAIEIANLEAEVITEESKPQYIMVAEPLHTETIAQKSVEDKENKISSSDASCPEAMVIENNDLIAEKELEDKLLNDSTESNDAANDSQSMVASIKTQQAIPEAVTETGTTNSIPNPESMAVTETDPISNIEKEPKSATDTEPKSVTEVEPVSVTDKVFQPLVETESVSLTEEEPKSVSQTEAKPIAEIKTNDLTETSEEKQNDKHDILPQENSTTIGNIGEVIDCDDEKETSKSIEKSDDDIVEIKDTTEKPKEKSKTDKSTNSFCLANTLDILSDDEEEVKKAEEPVNSSCIDLDDDKDTPDLTNDSKEVVENKCINLDDDDDVMLIDEDNSNGSVKEDNTQAKADAEPAKPENKTEDLPEAIKRAEENSKPVEVFSDSDKEISSHIINEKLDISEKPKSPKPTKNIEPAKPLVPENFLKKFKTNVAEMTRDELEEFCLMKIVEGVIDRSNLSDTATKLKTMAQNVEEWKKKAMMLTKQNRDLQIVVKTVQEEQMKRSSGLVTPLKITRSVGMQVVMTDNSTIDKIGNRRKSVQPPNVSAPRGGRTYSPRVTKQNNNPPPPIPVPRLVPATTNSPLKSTRQQTAQQTKPVAKNTPLVPKVEKRPYSSIQSVTVDLTDDEPAPKQQATTPKNPTQNLRLVSPQQLLTPRAQMNQNMNSPRKVFIPINSPNNAIRAGQTIMIKSNGPAGPRGPRGNMVRMSQAPVRLGRVAGQRHPAPLPEAPKQPQPNNWKALPPEPDLKISKVENGIVISWKIEGYHEDSYEEIASYQLYAYQETSTPPNTLLWKKIGDVKALPLPMACTLTQFMAGFKYYFAVRAVDIKSRIGPFSLPGSILLLNK